jgi:hypothetical protein
MITVPKHERGVTRVFALSMPEDQAQALHDDPVRQSAALGGADLSTSGIEVFKVSDLGELGLVGFLREGVDAQEKQINRDSAKLAALDGWVMLVHSSAFVDGGAALEPDPALTLIGTYNQQTSERRPVALKSDAAQPYTGSPQITPPPDPRTSSAGSMVVVGLFVLVALALWWALA